MASAGATHASFIALRLSGAERRPFTPTKAAFPILLTRVGQARPLEVAVRERDTSRWLNDYEPQETGTHGSKAAAANEGDLSFTLRLLVLTFVLAPRASPL